MDPHPPPAPAPLAAFLEEVRTNGNIDRSSSDFENILAELPPQELRNHRRGDYFNLYVQALAANEHLDYLCFAFTRFTDICFLKHLHSHVTLRSLRLQFEPRDEDNYHYEDLDDETQAAEVERTLAQFIGLKKLDIRVGFADGAPRFAQALLKGISKNSSLRDLSVFDMDDFGLQELDWTESKLQKLQIWGCDFSFSTWKSLLTIPSLESLNLATLSGRDREELGGRIPRHVMTRQHVFRSLPAQCRSIRHLIINWQETDIADLESMIRFFQFEKLTLDLTGLQLGDETPVPPAEEFQEKFSRICGLIDPANSKLHFVFDSLVTSLHFSGFPELLRMILGFRAVVGMAIILEEIEPDLFDHEHSSQCLLVFTQHHGAQHLEQLDISGLLDPQDNDIVNIISSFPRLQYLTVFSPPTLSTAEAVDAHTNLLQFEGNLFYPDSDNLLGSIETSLHRNRANRFALRIASRTSCSDTGAGLKLWPTILSNVDKGNVAALSGVFQAFRCDLGRLLVGGAMGQHETQPPPSEKMVAGRKRSRELM